MTDELKPVRCGCGGKADVLVGYPNRKGQIYYRVKCWECGTQTIHKRTREEAIEAWNKAMGNRMELQTVERTAKAIEHDASVTDTDGYKYHRSEYLCSACKKKVLGGEDYCSHCGAKLDWGKDD